jgi:hypothetical protein
VSETEHLIDTTVRARDRDRRAHRRRHALVGPDRGCHHQPRGYPGGKVYPPGAILTRRDVLAELPFGNRLVTLNVSGARRRRCDVPRYRAGAAGRGLADARVRGDRLYLEYRDGPEGGGGAGCGEVSVAVSAADSRWARPAWPRGVRLYPRRQISPARRQVRRVGLRLGMPVEGALTFVPFQNCLLSVEPGRRTDWGTIWSPRTTASIRS